MRDRAPALRVYRGLLWLYPAEFRDHFAGEMCRALADCLRQRPHPVEVLGLYLGVLIDAPKERYHMIHQDVVYALRTMRREKLNSLVAMLVLALGIGSTATVFTLVNSILLKPLPYPDQNRIVYVEEVSREINGAVAYPNYRDFQDRNRTLEDIAMFGSGLATLRGDIEAERVPSGSGTEALFRVLGIQPLLGRTFTIEECRLNAPSTVLLSENLWRRRYGGDPGIIGKTIGVGSDQARVVGVMPSGFHFPDVAELWMPLQFDPKHNTRMDHGLEAIARLRRGASVEQAQDDLRGIMRQIIQEHPTENYGQTVNVSPYRERDTQKVKPVLYTLMGAVGFVLLIACANITNLLLVKASARTREIAVRGALGASRARLVRQFMVESVLLGLAGAAGGIVLAWAAIPALLALVPEHLPMWIQFTPDARVLAFVTAITAGTAILAGAVPAWSASRFNLVETLKEGGRGSTPGGANAWFRNGLVVAEVAMSVLLLAGAGLMVETFWKLNSMQAGFRTENITTLQTAAPSDRYPNGRAAIELVRRIRKELAALPGVISVAGASGVPLLGRWGRSFTVEGAPLLGVKDAPIINHTLVTPGYFQTLGIPILQGRDFNQSDGKNPLVTIVDEGIAKHYWPHESAVGKRVRYGPPEDNEPWHTIVGVVGNARNQSLRDLRHNSVYLPLGEYEWASIAYLVRSAGGLADPAKSLRARLALVDRNVAVSRVLSMKDVVTQSIWRERFFATIFGFFAVLALLLALVGLYGVMAYAVSRRTHEMGIRMALGATSGEIRGMVLAQSGRLVLAGLATGTVAAVFLTRLLETQLFEVSPGDPKTLVTVAALLAAAAMAASYIPARKATRVDPMTALREE
ncbi:MAG TPA: ABC transporter permease [Bryobacteraceae bacterium]|nr:ABC transporter permease [Bryobacteraceae bacterium]